MKSAVVDEFQQYKTPRKDHTALVEPGVAALRNLLASPGNANANSQLEFCGKSLETARQQARAEVVELARRYSASYQDASNQGPTANAADTETPIVMSGHQPELFHPGVWFKNFLLSRLSAETGAIAINFLVDNDVCRSATIRVPTSGSANSVVAQSIPFDNQRDNVPWELRQLNSKDTWESFASRISKTMLAGAQQPLLQEMWPQAVEAVRRTNRIGLAIAESRHKLEASLGLSTLEVPLSSLVSTRAFARFSIQLLSELPRFQEVYNSQLLRYRTAHQIRNHAHPVPALEQDSGWLEAPWWIYRETAPRRQKMWVRLLDNQLLLSDRAGWQAVIEGRLDCDNAATQWLELLADGICLRPRALLTTMYLRIFVSDLFVHGIGGGKYDQLTNAIMSEFFGIRPPPMAVATATLQLPIAEAQAGHPSRAELEDEIRKQRESVWQMRFHADQAVADDSPEAELLSQRKQELLKNIPPRGEKWEWHREMTAINKRLSELVVSEINASKSEIDRLNILERQQKILESREYSFCLFSKAYIAEALERLSAG